jgi:uncharacterized protein with HEPN domain
VRNDKLRLLDIRASIAEIADSLPPSQADFDANKFVQSHILRHIQIIGEAAWRVSQATKDLYPHIPWKRIAAMRHVLVHNYFEVRWPLVFETARNDVPALKPQIEAVLTSLPPDPQKP